MPMHHTLDNTAVSIYKQRQEMWGFAGDSVGSWPTASPSGTRTHCWPSKSTGASSPSCCGSCMACNCVGKKTTKHTCAQTLLIRDCKIPWARGMCIAGFTSFFTKSVASLQEGALLLFFNPQEGWWVNTSNRTSVLAFLG